MSRSKSSRRWMQEHVTDEFVKKAKVEGYRSRAAYKLLEINEKDNLIRSGSIVIDLGAAPGGWSQVASGIVGDRGEVIAVDLLEMDSFSNLTFIQGDFRENEIYQQIIAAIDNRHVDLVMSDMAPNISGIEAVDQPRAMYLIELALDLATQVLSPGGQFVAKAFQGEGFEPWYQQLRKSFKAVKSRKPKSSRDRSREMYVVAKGFKGK